jgi:hypothetical protein
VRLFFPFVDSVSFIDHWTPRYADDLLFLASQDGTLLPAGSGPDAHKAVGQFLLKQGWHAPARDYLGDVLVKYPDDPDLRLLYATALFELGERASALEQLDRIARSAPATDAGRAAAMLKAAVADSTRRGTRAKPVP